VSPLALFKGAFNLQRTKAVERLRAAMAHQRALTDALCPEASLRDPLYFAVLSRAFANLAYQSCAGVHNCIFYLYLETVGSVLTNLPGEGFGDSPRSEFIIAEPELNPLLREIHLFLREVACKSKIDLTGSTFAKVLSEVPHRRWQRRAADSLSCRSGSMTPSSSTFSSVWRNVIASSSSPM
jgi:hypothetical protein